LAILKMDKIKILGLRKDKASVLQFMQKRGVVELIETGASESELPIRTDQPEQGLISQTKEADILRNQTRLNSAIQTLETKYANIPQESTDLKISAQDLLSVKEREKEILDLLDLMNSTEERQMDLAAEREQIQREQDILYDWRMVEIDLHQTSTKRTLIFLGRMEKSALAELEQELNELDLAETAIITLESGDTFDLTAVVALREHELAINQLLKQYDFNYLPITKSGTPNQIYRSNERKINNIDITAGKLEAKMKSIAAKRLDFYLLSDYYTTILEYYSASKIPEDTLYTFFLEGFIPRKVSREVEQKLEDDFTIFVEVIELEPEDEYPILLKNKPFAGSFQTILEMFGAPSTREIDPTPGLAPFTFMFFGMMLSDVGYGLLLTICCAYLIWKKKIDTSTESGQLVRMLFLCGISSTLWGFVFGGFFGDMLTLMSNNKITFPCLWFNPMEEPQKLLIWSMIFGVIHLFGGMVMKIINEIKFGKISNIFFDTIPWFFIIIGLGLMLGGSSLNIAAFDIGEIGKWLAIVGAAIVLLFAGRAKKNIFSRLITGIGGLYGVINYLGDILSYTRVLALVLATSVIATVVNFLASMVSGGIIGWIFAVVILIGGHILNLALSGLSAYVHSSRLQYVEFFGQFFEGGGRFFKPLKYKTNYLKIKEEE
jgi:V/A-type H+-transporting ATPase subunit I